jgi:hypothetical protein
MAETFTPFNDRNREPNVVYNSAAYTVPDDKMVRLTLTGLDLVNEPSTTIFYWQIEKAPSAGGPWTHMVGTSVRGQDGVPPHKPVNTIACSIDGVVGWQLRGNIYFVSANDQRKRWGVSGETYDW